MVLDLIKRMRTQEIVEVEDYYITIENKFVGGEDIQFAFNGYGDLISIGCWEGGGCPLFSIPASDQDVTEKLYHR